VAASTAAFLVVRGWDLAGTVAGAALFPVIYVLVSHGSNEGVETLNKWAQRRKAQRAGRSGAVTPASGAAGSTEPGAGGSPGLDNREPRRPTVYASGASSEASSALISSGAAARVRRHARNQWLLTGVAVVALGVSVYALVTASPGETTVLRETVIQGATIDTQQTVAEDGSPGIPGGESGGTGQVSPTTAAETTTTTADPDSTSTTVDGTAGTTVTDASSTTASTTESAPATTVSLPGSAVSPSTTGDTLGGS